MPLSRRRRAEKALGNARRTAKGLRLAISPWIAKHGLARLRLAWATGHFLGRKSSPRLRIHSHHVRPSSALFWIVARDCFQPSSYPPYDSGLGTSNLMHPITLLQGLLEPPMFLLRCLTLRVQTYASTNAGINDHGGWGGELNHLIK